MPAGPEHRKVAEDTKPNFGSLATCEREQQSKFQTKMRVDWGYSTSERVVVCPVLLAAAESTGCSAGPAPDPEEALDIRTATSDTRLEDRRHMLDLDTVSIEVEVVEDSAHSRSSVAPAEAGVGNSPRAEEVAW